MKFTVSKMLPAMAIAIVLPFVSSLRASAQDEITLGIGDAAPALKYSQWVKGTPVTSYEKDRMYVLEFWATWCGPCKQAMPHLSELAKKYEDQATFVGINIWEKTGDKPYESCLPAVTKFVHAIGDKMAYNVAVDNNDQYMVNTWMKPAGQMGIPSTFLVKEGKIVWIGHPINLDSIMGLVIEGKYDMTEFKKKQAESQAKMAAQTAKFTTVLKPIQDAIKAKDYPTALELVDKGLTEGDQMLFWSLNSMKLDVLYNYKGEDAALQFGKELYKTNKQTGTMTAGYFGEKENLKKDTYFFAISVYEDALASNSGMVTPIVHHYIAALYGKVGDYTKAIAHEELAIKDAKAALNEGKWLGTIMDYTVTEYEEALEGFKKVSGKKA